MSELDIKTLLQGYAEQGTISKYGVPDRIVLASSLPKTSVGKLDKKVLREQYASQLAPLRGAAARAAAPSNR